jgi:pimeloyl-ACP methyl ester carboxylesterase
MASRKTGNTSKSTPRTGTPQRPSPLAQQLPLVSGRWLLWSLAGIFGGGFVLVYLTMVLLFWQGQWQILFHPDRTDNAIVATVALPFQHIAFDTTQTGRPLLDGWFIPAELAGMADARYANETILYLHSMQTGSLAGAGPELTELHQLGINLFAFDYRGFGQSEFLHPSEQTTSEDVEAAWQYLVETRHVAPQSILVYGQGLAAALAAQAISHHSDASGLVMDRPLPKAVDLLRADPRSKWMPVSLLTHDVFDPSAALAQTKQPKLLVLAGEAMSNQHYAEIAAEPKRIVHLQTSASSQIRLEALRQYLDELPATKPPTRQK